MPLIHSASNKAFDRNVSTLMNERGKSPHVKDRAQALAIAFATKRRAQHRAFGGFSGRPGGGPWGLPNQAMSGAASNPAATAPQFHAPMPVAQPGVAPPNNMMAARQMPVNPAATAPAPMARPMPMPMMAAASSAPSNPAATAPMNPAASFGSMGMAMGGIAPPSWQERAEARQLTYSHPVMSAVQRFGSARRPFQQGGVAPFAEREEARQLMHTGPIISAVPGRTDRHNMSVPSGSYVVPAETVSHLGQSNTLSGMKILGRMFGPGGRYNASAAPALGRGSRALGADRGGARGKGIGAPTDVVTAGGEYIIPPAVVMNVGGGNLKRGHEILDHWVMSLRQEHIRTLKGLKPPAKS